MHDRKNLCAPVIILFHLAIIGKESHDVRIAMDRVRQHRADNGVYSPALQQVAQRLVRGIAFDRYGAQQRQEAGMAMSSRLIDRAFAPVALAETGTMLALEGPRPPSR